MKAVVFEFQSRCMPPGDRSERDLRYSRGCLRFDRKRDSSAGRLSNRIGYFGFGAGPRLYLSGDVRRAVADETDEVVAVFVFIPNLQ